MSSTLEAIRTISEVAVEDLPQPQGFYILVRMRKVSEKVSQGSRIYVPESRIADENMAIPLGDVVLMGPDCFSHPDFCGKARCKVGDTILMAPYAGQRVLIGDQIEAEEYRVITDAVVACIVPRPELVRRNL